MFCNKKNCFCIRFGDRQFNVYAIVSDRPLHYLKQICSPDAVGCMVYHVTLEFLRSIALLSGKKYWSIPETYSYGNTEGNFKINS